MPTPRPVTAKKKRKYEWLNYAFKWLKYWGNVIMSDPEKKNGWRRCKSVVMRSAGVPLLCLMQELVNSTSLQDIAH